MSTVLRNGYGEPVAFLPTEDWTTDITGFYRTNSQASAVGQPKEKIRIEPVEDPVPQKTPAPVEAPAETPAPTEVPEKVPA